MLQICETLEVIERGKDMIEKSESLNKLKIHKMNREGKGKSIIAFPSSYCVVDIETTGLCYNRDNIIEIGAIRYSNGIETDCFQTLVQPPITCDGTYVNDFITGLTGITNTMLADAPKASDAINNFSKFLGNDVIVGYNVGFDVNFLFDCYKEHLGKSMSNDYIDIMRISRKLYPDMPHHRLCDMMEKYGIEDEQEHRSVSDIKATAVCYKLMHEEVIRQYNSDEIFIKSFEKHINNKQSIKAGDIRGDRSKYDFHSVLYNKYCVFTGKLEKFTRKQAMQIIADLGGINEDTVTQKTNYLILGNNDYCSTIKEGKSGKQKKAEKYKLNGQDIEIIPENEFYDMIGDLIQMEKNDLVNDQNSIVCKRDWQEEVREMLDRLICEHELPIGSLYLSDNSGTKDPKRIISHSVCIWEPNYPPIPNDKPGQNKIVMTIYPSDIKSRLDDLDLNIRKEQESNLRKYLPEDAYLLSSTKSDKDLGVVRIRINKNSCNLKTYIKEHTEYCIERYVSKAASFGCCSSFRICSDKKKCVHENKLYSKACLYRKNLDQGKIFYGKNKNID